MYALNNIYLAMYERSVRLYKSILLKMTTNLRDNSKSDRFDIKV